MVLPLAMALAMSGNPAHATDLPLQRVAQAALGNRPGTIVALNAKDGRLLAVINPRVAAGGAYPIGSLAKLVTGMAALEARAIDGARTFPCKGRFERWKCWQIHGNQTLEEAIAHSCSSFFFAAGRELGARRLNQAFTRAGFGRSTGSDLPAEAAGTFTPARNRAELTELAYGDTPALQATPLQVAAWMGAIANGGTRYRPHLGSKSPQVLGLLSGAAAIANIQTGMRRAVLEGSANKADFPGLSVYGKTGTSTQLRAGARDSENRNRHHGWFAGFAGELVVVVFVKDGSGYADAAPIAREVFAAWH